MKRVKRIVALALALLLCLPLCSCKELDDMRDRQAVRQKDGTLLFNEQIYKVLPYTGEALNQDTDYDGQIMVTELGVPVLLSKMMGSYARTLGDGAFIEFDAYDNEYYCREDLYDELVAVVEENAPISKYYYTYYIPRNIDYILTVEQMAVIDAVLRHAEELVDPKEVHTNYSLKLYGLTEDGWFRKNVCRIEYNIDYSDNHYYLVPDIGSQYIRVPEEYEPIFTEIVAKQREWYYSR